MTAGSARSRRPPWSSPASTTCRPRRSGWRSTATKIRGAEMAVIEDAGHFPNWDRAESFNRVYGDFLARTG